MFSVFGTAYQNKVFNIVVKFISVNVMNNFRRQQGAFKVFFHNMTMLINLISINWNKLISCRFINGSLSMYISKRGACHWQIFSNAISMHNTKTQAIVRAATSWNCANFVSNFLNSYRWVAMSFPSFPVHQTKHFFSGMDKAVTTRNRTNAFSKLYKLIRIAITFPSFPMFQAPPISVGKVIAIFNGAYFSHV